MKTNFQQVFFTVVAFTCFSGIGAIALAPQQNPSAQETRIFEICNTTWNLGIGAIFGLLGGAEPPSKSSRSDQENDQDKKTEA